MANELDLSTVREIEKSEKFGPRLLDDPSAIRGDADGTNQSEIVAFLFTDRHNSKALRHRQIGRRGSQGLLTFLDFHARDAL